MLPSERELARLHGINRQPVREALARLRQQRLVEVVHGEGTRVRDWKADSHLSVLVDAAVTPDGQPNLPVAGALLRLRAVTLIEAARLAAERHTEDDVVALRAAATGRHIGGDGVPHLWAAVVEASKCLACRLLHNTMERTAARLPDDLVHAVADGDGSDDAQALVTAIEARDGRAAADAAQRILAPAVVMVEGVW